MTEQELVFFSILFIIIFILAFITAFIRVVKGDRKMAHLLGRIGSGVLGGLTVYIMLSKETNFKIGYIVLLILAIGLLFIEYALGNETTKKRK